MFEHLAKFTRVLVTGPQRSGTRICAQMIASDLSKLKAIFVDEREFGIDRLSYFMNTIFPNKKIIVHCPAFSRYIHNIADGKTAVVWMVRPVAEIHKSEKRIGWDGHRAESLRYDGAEDTALVTYRFWEKSQKANTPNVFEVPYGSLAKHKLWVPKRQRAKFDAEQTVVGQ